MSPTIKDLLGFVVNPPPGDPTMTANADLLPRYAVVSSPASANQVPVADGLGGYTWQAPAGGPPTGAASGDLSGTYPSPTVAKVNGQTVPLTTAAWIAPTLINSWANFGSGFESAGYLKDPLGFVHLKGMISGGATGSVAFVLPAGYRPGATTNSPLGQSSATGVAQAAINGNLTLVFATPAVPYGLSGITFLAEN